MGLRRRDSGSKGFGTCHRNRGFLGDAMDSLCRRRCMPVLWAVSGRRVKTKSEVTAPNPQSIH